MKEMKFEIPAGFDAEKVETTDGHVVIALKEKERKLPKSWEEFCAYYPVPLSFSLKQDPRAPIAPTQIELIFMLSEFTKDRKIAEAVFALCKLILLRDCYNGDWVPDWKDKNEDKYVIEFYEEEIEKDVLIVSSQTPLFFKSEKIRDEFLCYFRPLIEKLKPLYGIKKGGEE